MSQVRIQGNASGTGTLTIASPNTNSDFTLNLPASGGTFVVDGASQSPTFNAVTATSVATTSTTTTTLAVAGNNISAVNSLGFRNRIINGDMRINQRGGTVTSPSGSVAYGIDRWRIVRFNDTTGTFTFQQSTTVPSGFTNSGLITVTAAQASVPSNGLYRLDQLIEGFNVSDLGWGAAGAQSITVGFWVRSSVTGTFGARVCNSAETRSYVFQYTVNAANTYEFKTVTIPGDTTGTWLTDNGIGIGLNFDIGSGTSFEGTANAWNASNVCRASGNVRLINTLNATLFITGVQLEAGSVASPFERRDYGRELIMCQRYYEVGGGVTLQNNVGRYQTFFFKNTKRAAATITNSRSVTPGGDRINYWYQDSNDTADSIMTFTASAEL